MIKPRKENQTPLRIRIVNLMILLLCLSLTLNFVRSVGQLLKTGAIMAKSQKRLDEVQEENEELKRKLAQTQTKIYIEQQARDKLNVSKPDEAIVLLPTIYPSSDITPTPQLNPPILQWFETFR